MSVAPWRGARPILLALIAVVLVLGAIGRIAPVRAGLADLLPSGGSEAMQLIAGEMRDGAASGLILIGIDGATPDQLAHTSRAMASSLRQSGEFAFVLNSAGSFTSEDENFLFAHRYLLAPAAPMTEAALREDFAGVLEALESSAAPVAERYALADPTSAFVTALQTWSGDSRISTHDGVWFDPARNRAVLIARARADSMDWQAQEAAAGTITRAFTGAAAALQRQPRLLLTGPAIFARDAALAIRQDVTQLSVLSTILLVMLLLWRFRSPLAILVIAIPPCLGAAAAILAVWAMFGYVHAITIGFGVTMLGVTVDYPVLLIGHRKHGEAIGATLRRIGRSFTLAVATAAIGLTGMAASGLPGLAQLGVFSVTGILVSALATRFVLPNLVIAADLAAVSAAAPRRLLRLENLRAWRLCGLIPLAAAAGFLALNKPVWEQDIAALSPVPEAALAADAELRAAIGAPDTGQFIALRGPDAEAVLQQEEALLPALTRLRERGGIGGVEIAAALLPSVRTQRARQQALPDSATLAPAIAGALIGLPFQPGAFDGFAASVARSRALAPVTLDSLASPLMQARLHPLLFQRGGTWRGLVIPRGLAQDAEFAALAATIPGAVYVDTKAETSALLAGYTDGAWRWLAVGTGTVILMLLIGLRDVLLTFRVIAALVSACAVTIALLTLGGQRLTLLHVVALQFVFGAGLDYALFFARRQQDAEERARTLRTLITCNAAALAAFGLLALCRTPILHSIGTTVAAGVLSAMAFAFLFAGERPRTALSAAAA